MEVPRARGVEAAVPNKQLLSNPTGPQAAWGRGAGLPSQNPVSVHSKLNALLYPKLIPRDLCKL